MIVDYVGTAGGCATWRPHGADRQGAENYAENHADRQVAENHSENYFDSHVSIVRDWLDAIGQGSEPRVPGREGLADLAVVAAAESSLANDGAFVPIGRSG